MKKEILKIGTEPEEDAANRPIQPLTRTEMQALLNDPRFADAARMFLSGLNNMQANQPIAPRPPRKSNAEKALDAIREKHTEEEIEYAYKWVVRVFANMLNERPADESPGAPYKPHIMLAVLESTERTRKAKMTTAPDRFKIHFGVFADEFALHYIDVILEHRKKGDRECLLAIVEHARVTPDLHWRQLRHLLKKHRGKPYVRLQTAQIN